MLTEGVCALSLNVCMFHTCRFNQHGTNKPTKNSKTKQKFLHLYRTWTDFLVFCEQMCYENSVSFAFYKESRDDLRYLGGVCKQPANTTAS